MSLRAAIVGMLVAQAAAAQWATWTPGWASRTVRSNLLFALEERMTAPVRWDHITNSIPAPGFWSSRSWMNDFDDALRLCLTTTYVNVSAMSGANESNPAWDDMQVGKAIPTKIFYTLPDALTAAGYPGWQNLTTNGWWAPAHEAYLMRKAVLNLMRYTVSGRWEGITPAGVINAITWDSGGTYLTPWEDAVENVAPYSTNTSAYAGAQPGGWGGVAAQDNDGTLEFFITADRARAYPTGFHSFGSNLFEKTMSLYFMAQPVGSWDAQGETVSTNLTNTGISYGPTKRYGNNGWTVSTWMVASDIDLPDYGTEPATEGSWTKGFTIQYAWWLADWMSSAGGFKFKP